MSYEPERLDAATARQRALGWLARREYGCQELIEKLVRRGCAEADARQIVATLTAEGAVSDERFIEALLHVRRSRGYGPLYIRREMEGKGIGREAISRWLDPNAHDWQELARVAKDKRFGKRPPASMSERARQTRFLQQRGFTHEQIRNALGSED